MTAVLCIIIPRGEGNVGLNLPVDKDIHKTQRNKEEDYPLAASYNLSKHQKPKIHAQAYRCMLIRTLYSDSTINYGRHDASINIGRKHPW